MSGKAGDFSQSREVTYERNERSTNKTTSLTRCCPAEKDACVPKFKEVVDERGHEIVDLVECRFLRTRDDAGKIDILWKEAQVRRQVETSHVYRSDGVRFSRLLVPERVEPVDEQAEHQVQRAVRLYGEGRYAIRTNEATDRG